MTSKRQRTATPNAAETAPTNEESSETPAQSLSFEAAIQRLGAIVDQLEAGDMPLEDSLALFEEGIKLARTSQARLEAAEQRIEKLLAIDESGTPIVESLDLPETP